VTYFSCFATAPGCGGAGFGTEPGTSWGVVCTHRRVGFGGKGELDLVVLHTYFFEQDLQRMFVSTNLTLLLDFLSAIVCIFFCLEAKESIEQIKNLAA
jgi:hypothetical protein